MKVLIVDDETFICESIKADFQRMEHPWEYEVFTAQSVTAAQKIYYREEPDFVITDINMPGGSGLILVSEIHKENPDCALLVLSAYDDFEYVRNAFKMGAWDYILKPIAFSELEKCVERLARKIITAKDGFPSEKNTGSEEEKGIFRIEDAVAYIGGHIGEKLSASEMAHKMAISYSNFGKQFREYTGMSFSAYLIHSRMECAKDYLENSAMKIKQVASKVGYRENPQHFSRDFTRHVGMSPKEYRAQKFEERKGSIVGKKELQ